jgi:plasmid stabilization system protein ParE
MLWPIRWSAESEADMGRIVKFLEVKSKPVAKKTALSLIAYSERLQQHPRLGEQLFEFTNTEVRRFIAGQYEMRYQVDLNELLILRIWHTREQRH